MSRCAPLGEIDQSTAIARGGSGQGPSGGQPRATGSVAVSSPQLPGLNTAAPPQFDGPGGVWSPETLLCASLADCFILTFRAVSRAARLEWLRLECQVEGVLERVGEVSQFTRYTTTATLTVPPGTDAAQAREILERAEHGCLIANSLRGARLLNTRVLFTEPAATAPFLPSASPANR